MEGTEEAFEAAAAVRQAAAKRARAQNGGDDKASKSRRVSGKIRDKSCTHIVAVPDGFDVDSIKLDPALHGTLNEPHYAKDKYKKTYPFELDPFQSTSVACLERVESVMVAAHTSAGKTVVAEYAVAKALQAKQRVIYTSPLKALSNQKYRELQEEFGDVGLMTGDVTINTDASCVVMTTEILRAMLYRGSEMMREIAWVIFDEIHYMQDRERGVVWEETIISLPRAVRMVFLSATLSNAQEFAEWVASLHRQPCHVVYTDYRPTPLEHFGMPCLAAKEDKSKKEKAGGLYRILTMDGVFLVKMWEELAAAGLSKDPWATEGGENGASKDGKTGEGDKASLGMTRPKRDLAGISDRVVEVLRLAELRSLYPMIVFSFARRECEVFAMSVWKEGEKRGGLDFTTDEEKEAIEMVFEQAVASLGDDADLAAVQNTKKYLLKGIGVHHGGLIPLVKELVEILFQESLVKVLFATETFAMGLNMPARAVVFTSHVKNDGMNFRPLTSGEYIQMSGRAGRRGRDDRGYCIMMVEDPDVFSPPMAKNMMQGSAMPLLSRFKLSYYTLLNLQKRREGGLDQMEYLVQHSFQQFQHEKAMPSWQARLAEIDAKLSSPEAAGLTREACEEYVRLKDELGLQQAVLHSAMIRPSVCKPFLTTGRLLRVQEGATDWGWGILLQMLHRPATPADEGKDQGNGAASKDGEADKADRVEDWQLVLLLPVLRSSIEVGSGPPAPARLDDEHAALIPVPVPLSLVVSISKHRTTLPMDVRPDTTRATVLRDLNDFVTARCNGPENVPLLHPVDDLNLSDARVLAALPKIDALKKELGTNTIYQQETGGGAQSPGLFEEFRALTVEREQLKKKISRSQLQDFRSQVVMRKKVLRRLGHLTADGLLTAKGKAAAEIDTADELMTTELMFNAVWKTLDSPQLVALLSCLVPCFEKVDSEKSGVRLPLQLAGALSTLQEFAGHICDVTNECGIELDKDRYTTGFTPTLMTPLYQWAQGATFKEVIEGTMIFEGTLIRCTRRLMELMNQVIYAAQVIGEKEMEKQMQKALSSLQRGIMFCGSLYL